VERGSDRHERALATARCEEREGAVQCSAGAGAGAGAGESNVTAGVERETGDYALEMPPGVLDARRVPTFWALPLVRIWHRPQVRATPQQATHGARAGHPGACRERHPASLERQAYNDPNASHSTLCRSVWQSLRTPLTSIMPSKHAWGECHV
jgi:hypothetical protein